MIKTKTLTPKLRFPGFSDEWQVKKLSQIIDSIDSGVSVNSEDRHKNGDEYGILKTSAVSGGKFYPNEHKAVLQSEQGRVKLNPKADSIIVSRMNTPQLVGESGYVDQDYNDLFIPDRLWQVTTNHESNAKWLSYILAGERVKIKLTNIASGTSNSMKNISQPSFSGLKVTAPSVKEQEKIAHFLTAVDEKITTIDKNVELLKKYKNGVMQKIFTQKIRFNDEKSNSYPDWEEKKLGDVTDLFSTRNKKLSDAAVYSVTNKKGFVLQTDHFSKVVAGDDLSGYKLIEKNDFAYNPARINVGSIARFKNDYGVISSLYVCFRVKQELNPTYLEYFLKLDSTRFYFNTYGEGGVRIYLWYPLFSLIKINLPTLPEQQKIASFLTALDDKISLEESKLASAKQFKKALLQRMFI